MNKKFFCLQSLVLLFGTIFAWYTVVGDFIKYFRVEDSLFKFQNCLAPNPLSTACFYGALAFLAAFAWSVMILKMPEEKQISQQKKLIILLIAGTIFAWGNFSYGMIKFLNANNRPVTGCSGNIVVNPFNTPCFYGALFFSAGLIVSLIVSKKQKLND